MSLKLREDDDTDTNDTQLQKIKCIYTITDE